MPFYKRIQYNSPVVLTYALVALAVLLLDQITQGAANFYFFSVHRGSPTDPLLYFRMIGHVIGHANLSHYFNNVVLLLLVGPMLEERYGGKKILLMMLITALVTGILFLAVSDGRLLGGSGLVFMLILLSSFTNLQKGRIPLTLILAVAIFIGREVVAEVTTETNISNVTHIIGGICGAAFGYFFNKPIFATAKTAIAEDILEKDTAGES
ncbi:MAG: rhomboid family intramembrane serine protease [Defluviitaleaceae bacterium]|nr:rhomboid family intramembrane serine protease [Defluviitaleaceae bacterium]